MGSLLVGDGEGDRAIMGGRRVETDRDVAAVVGKEGCAVSDNDEDTVGEVAEVRGEGRAGDGDGGGGIKDDGNGGAGEVGEADAQEGVATVGVGVGDELGGELGPAW